jgi:hypothetical protein
LKKRSQESGTCVRIAGPGRQPRIRRRGCCGGRVIAQLRHWVLLLLRLLRLRRDWLRALGLLRLRRRLLAHCHRLRLALLVLHLGATNAPFYLHCMRFMYAEEGAYRA